MTVRFGLEHLQRELRGRRVGVVSGPASWLPGNGDFGEYVCHGADVRGFLALEHGLRGELQDGVHFDSYRDARTGVPVYSFYNREQKLPAEFLAAVEVVVFHVQDVSHRAYTFHGAMADLLSAARENGPRLIVLDRPTPLGHLGAYGYRWPQFFPLPLPMGIPATHGELARWLAAARGWSESLTVIPVEGWQRTAPWPESLPWIAPSPNLPTLASAYAYACAGIVQATNVSEGRGTCKPFEYIGAPFVDAARLARTLNDRHLPGILFREVYFKPGFNKFAGEVCAGVHLLFSDPLRLDPLRTLLAILQDLARLHPGGFETKPGLNRWLDGGTWDAARLADLDLDAACREAAVAADIFRQEMAPISLYD